VQLHSHHKKNIRRISLTPLADLVFILLVFFILETSFTEFRELGFNVPEREEQSKSAGEQLNLQLFEDGKLWIQGEAIALDGLGSYLDSKQFDAETAVLLEVHDLAALQLLVNAMDQLKAHALEKIQILPLGKTESASKVSKNVAIKPE
jgi:biopolymer transport protein ExbD